VILAAAPPSYTARAWLRLAQASLAFGGRSLP